MGFHVTNIGDAELNVGKKKSCKKLINMNFQLTVIKLLEELKSSKII